MLRSLLTHAYEEPQTVALSRQGGRAFVSQSLAPYLIAALLDGDRDRPAIVVAGDDRAARDLAAALRAWLEPRLVRQYPSRGVTYESHLVPPPHLVGLRIAALDVLLGAGEANAGTVNSSDGGAPVVVVSAVALSEKIPDPALRPHGFSLHRGGVLDLDEAARALVAAGYERVDQVGDRGQFAIRGGLLDLFPATEERAVRVELFGDEIESLRWFSTFTQRSLADTELVEVAPAAELSEEHRELAEIAALEEEAADRPDIAELLPVGDFHPFLEIVPANARVVIAGEEDVSPALSDHWQDVTAAFHDHDAHHLYVPAQEIAEALEQRASIRISSIDQDQPFSFRAQSADVAARGVTEAEPELEKLTRSGYRTVIAFARRGEGERAAYNLGRLKVGWLDGDGGHRGALSFAHARLQSGFIAPQLHLAVIPDHRLFRRRRAAQPRPQRQRGVLRSFVELRNGDIVVHEDHGIARFAGFETKTVAGVTRDYLYLEYAGSDRVFVPVDQLAKISRYVGAGGVHPPLSKLGGSRFDALKARARRAAQELAGELLNLYAERKRREGHAFSPDSDWQREFEDAFPYTETPDQRDAIDFVKADMESPRPMDRLICGDDGFGQTAVALRAAFIPAMAGSQDAIVVPPALLSRHHYRSFTYRFAGLTLRAIEIPVVCERNSGQSGVSFRQTGIQADSLLRGIPRLGGLLLFLVHLHGSSALSSVWTLRGGTDGTRPLGHR